MYFSGRTYNGIKGEGGVKCRAFYLVSVHLYKYFPFKAKQSSNQIPFLNFFVLTKPLKRVALLW